MIRRILAATALAAVVALAPMTAFGATYPAPGSALTCTQTTVVINATFSCTIQGPAGGDATLTATTSGANASIAGTVSLTKVISGTNAAVFSVTAPSATSTIVLAGAVDGTDTNAASVEVTSRTLAATGASIGVAIGSGALLLLGGTALIIGSRRRSKKIKA